MKHLCDREICRRAASEVFQNATSKEITVAEEMNLLGMNRRNYYKWESLTCAPSAFALSRMTFAHYDVIYILTGRKERKNESQS